MLINPFIAMVSFENHPQKCEISNPSLFLSSFSHWHVKGNSSECIALKTDVIGPEMIRFAGVSVHHSARKC